MKSKIIMTGMVICGFSLNCWAASDKEVAVQMIKELHNGQLTTITNNPANKFKEYLTVGIVSKLLKVIALRGWDWCTGEVTEENYVGMGIKGKLIRSKGSYLSLVFIFDRHKLAMLYLEPIPTLIHRYKDPEYMDSTKFSVQSVLIRSGDYVLPGTIVLPKSKENYPVLILVHGSGTNNRDESLYSLKPFRDLAVGLVNKGIASLRYDKRNKIYSEDNMEDDEISTIGTETTEDAGTAIKLAEQLMGTKHKFFVLGHSQGGMMVPLIVKDNPMLSGGIIFSGNAISLVGSYEKQYKVIRTTEEHRSKLLSGVDMVMHIDTVSDLKRIILGRPASFWKSLQDYKQLEVARDLKRPLLILQGEKDFQVSSDQLDMWKSAIDGKKGSSSKLYAKLNHFYSEGSDPDTSKEYMIPGNVPRYVLEDIAEWIWKCP